MSRYTVVLYPEAEGGYSAVVPLLRVASQGETVEEALAMVREAAELQVQGLIEDGEPVLEEDGPAIIATIELEVAATTGVS